MNDLIGICQFSKLIKIVLLELVEEEPEIQCHPSSFDFLQFDQTGTGSALNTYLPNLCI